ncbi:addiction module component [Pseudoalteromonas sp. AS84]|uniref:RelA/SpoT domain-containing protein n=1 Tax=Pseudoalteromonas sp. AS84 TaxID=3135778 RepID=UPI00316B81CB
MNIEDMELNEFLSRNKISEEKFTECALDWELIQSIGADHQSKIDDLEDLAESYAKTIQRFAKVHSVRWRVKDPEHLMEKIVRKTTKGSGSYNKKYINISVDNYSTKITDLIGIRALHLFKQDCVEIINSLEERWKKSEKITAYIREGDSKEDYKDRTAWVVKEHKAGYRSIHFVFSTSPHKSKVFTEVQVRTIFEEGWSEIDHKIRYPNFSDNKDIITFLNIFNRLAGSADEMGSFVKALSTMIQDRDAEVKKLENENTKHKDKITMLLDELKEKTKSPEVSKLVNNLETELVASNIYGYINNSANLSSIVKSGKDMANAFQSINNYKSVIEQITEMSNLKRNL